MPAHVAAQAAGDALPARYREVRAATVALAEPLSAEDQCVQSMPDASPTKWHLAHTTWFFEAFVLGPMQPGYAPCDPSYRFLFNSYYESLGPRQPRPSRGLITRPGCGEVMRYRERVDAAMAGLLETGEAAAAVELGLHHEQQHQELILTDIKHALAQHPFDPLYRRRPPCAVAPAAAAQWLAFPGGVREIGAPADGFAFDNERPRHAVLLAPYRLADRPVNCGEYLAFIDAGGYERPEFWLADGWLAVREQAWRAPLYWRRETGGEWSVFTLHGRCPLDPAEPVCHVSLYEAAAYAAWAGARLPTEFEWEAAAAGRLPAAGQVWEWTRSAYAPYPGFAPLPGAAGEYNGKFMVGQYVLRGGSRATPAGHLRPSYRNFFPPGARWQFSGIRLACDR